MDTVLWLCPSLPTETLKWLSSLPILMQESFWWWQRGDRYIISLFPHLHTPPPPPPPPPSPSLISLMVSVDVKHHVYILGVKHQVTYSKASPFDQSVHERVTARCVTSVGNILNRVVVVIMTVLETGLWLDEFPALTGLFVGGMHCFRYRTSLLPELFGISAKLPVLDTFASGIVSLM